MHKCSFTFSWIFGPKGWALSQAARNNPTVYRALLHVGREHFGLTGCVGGRLGAGLETIPGLYGTSKSVLVWHSNDDPNDYRT
mgnify:CR=1 FL=1